MRFVAKLASLLTTLAAVGIWMSPPAHAANTCNAFISIGYVTTQNFHDIGDQLRVVLTIGTGSINGGTQATVNRVRFELDCEAPFPLGLGCMDDGTIIKYLGDSTIQSDC